MDNEPTPQADFEGGGYYFELGFFTKLDKACDRFFRKRGMPTSYTWRNPNTKQKGTTSNDTETDSSPEA